MPSLPQRMRKLQTRLLNIRLGPGAVILPQEVKRIHMRFAPRMGGHVGAHKFWRQQLIRLKYHNPGVSMTTDRGMPPDGKPRSLMSIHFDEATERVEEIDMEGLTNSQILDQLVLVTKAHSVEPTERENETLRALQEHSARSARDRQSSLEARARVRRERELLEQAKGDLAA